MVPASSQLQVLFKAWLEVFLKLQKNRFLSQLLNKIRFWRKNQLSPRVSVFLLIRQNTGNAYLTKLPPFFSISYAADSAKTTF